MKKILLSIIAVIGIAAFSASAQDKMYRPMEFTDYAFEGILLQPQQQASIDSLIQNINGGAQCCDKAGNSDVVWHLGMSDNLQSNKYNKFESPTGGIPLWFFEGVYSILTPEQYVEFVNNLTTMPQDVKFYSGNQNSMAQAIM